MACRPPSARWWGTEGYKYAKQIKDDVQTFNDDAAVAQALDAGRSTLW